MQLDLKITLAHQHTFVIFQKCTMKINKNTFYYYQILVQTLLGEQPSY